MTSVCRGTFNCGRAGRLATRSATLTRHGGVVVRTAVRRAQSQEQAELRSYHRRAVGPSFFRFSFGVEGSGSGQEGGVDEQSGEAAEAARENQAQDVIARSRRTAGRMATSATVEDAMKHYTHSRDRAIDLGIPCFDDETLRRDILAPLLQREMCTSEDVMNCTEAVREVLEDMFNWQATTAASYLDILVTYIRWLKGRQRDGALLIVLRGAIVCVHRCLLQEREDERGVHNVHNVTALMNAYNHVGLTQSALEIWQRLLISHSQLTPATVSVVFDTCGHGGLLDEAQRAFAYVNHTSRKVELMDKNVWDAYLECLARCDQLKRAIELALTEMSPALKERKAKFDDRPKQASTSRYDNAATEPDDSTFRFLLQFAAAKKEARMSERDASIYPQLRRDIQKQYPQYWAMLKDVGTGRR